MSIGLPSSSPSLLRTLLEDPLKALLIKLHDCISRATTAFWYDRGASQPLLPITTRASSSPMGLGSDSLPVPVTIGGQPIYLADSMQFYLELAVRMANGPTYYVMPSFRGEPADSTHLPQFFHSEAEFDGDLAMAIETVEAYLAALTEAILADLAPAIQRRVGTVDHLTKFLTSLPFTRLTFDEAARLVAPYIHQQSGWRSLDRAGEQALLRLFRRPLWLTHFDELSVPFYQALSPDHPGRSANADLIFGLGEVVGAGQRHVTGTQVTSALARHHLAPQPYDWYVEMKTLAPRQTAGFGMGIERYLAWVLQVDDIRCLQLIPRDQAVNDV